MDKTDVLGLEERIQAHNKAMAIAEQAETAERMKLRIQIKMDMKAIAAYAYEIWEWKKVNADIAKTAIEIRETTIKQLCESIFKNKTKLGINHLYEEV